MIDKVRQRLNTAVRQGPSSLERRLHAVLADRNARRTGAGDAPWFASPEDRQAPPGILNRGGMLALAFDFLYGNLLRGDYFEFGSHSARTFRLAWLASLRHPELADTRFHLFDSFAGLPEPEGVDVHPKWRGGGLAFTVGELVRSAELESIPPGRYDIVEGFYEQSLTAKLAASLAGVRAGVVYVDCDLYESTKTVLEWIVPFLQSGTIVCFDDWFTFEGRPDRGEQLAAQEFLDGHPNIEFGDYAQFGWHGKSFIAHVRD